MRQILGMKKPEWPGIATSVGVVLILTIAIAGAEPGFKLKEWQPLMAAIIALAAGALAYRGAMAKVDYDRERDLRDIERKKAGLYLRLRHAIWDLGVESGRACTQLGVGRASRKMSASQIKITSRDEFEEAWKNLELFPVKLSFWLDMVRTELPRAQKRLDSIPPEDIIEIPMSGVSDFEPLGEYLKIAKRLREASEYIVDDLDKNIKHFGRG
jgi:hypothetical protein